jgi:hypothetical protein
MKKIHNNQELSFYRLPYADWLKIEESFIFSFISDKENTTLLDLEEGVYLAPFSQLVSVVRVNNSLYKLNGKKRKAFWASKDRTPPEFLIAQIIDLSEANFLALNNKVKNLLTGKQPLRPNELNESLKFYYEKLGMTLKSDRLKDGFIIDALNLALRGKPRVLQDKRLVLEKEEIDMIKALKIFKDNLKFIDDLQPKSEIFISGVLGAILLMMGLKKYSNNFIIRLNNLDGKIKNGLEDPVAGLLRAIENNRTGDPSVPAQMTVDIYRKTIQAILLWEEGPESPRYWRKKILSGVNSKPYIREFKSLNQLNDFRDL